MKILIINTVLPFSFVGLKVDLGGFPDIRLSGKDSTCKAGDSGSVPRLGRSPRGGNGSPLQYSCLENPVDRGAWRAIVHMVAKSRTQLSD